MNIIEEIVKNKDVKRKLCSKCGEVKDVSEFYRDGNSFCSQCKSCKKQVCLKSKERLLQEHKKFQEENPIEFKTCLNCKKTKHIGEFFKNRSRKDGFHNLCKICSIQANKELRHKNPEHFREYDKQNRLKSLEKHKECNRKSYQKHKDIISIKHKIYRDTHPEYFKKKVKEWSINNRDRINARDRQRCKEDINVRILRNLRGMLNHILRDNLTFAKKSDRTMNLIGCSIEDFKIHIEGQWLPGMTWDNWGKGEGKWNIHHIKQCASFNLSDPEQQRQCFHYTNLMPIWEKDHKLLHGKNWVRRQK